jgi:hypothetical protein
MAERSFADPLHLPTGREDCHPHGGRSKGYAQTNPDEASAVAAVTDVKCRTLETLDIERRLAALEQREQGTKRQ